LALPLLLLGNVGCLLPIGPLDVQMSVSRGMGANLKQDLGLTTDGLTLTVLGGLAPIKVPMWHIAWVSVGMYKVHPPQCGHLRGLEMPGWERMTRVRDEDGETVVFVQAGNDPLGAMAVVISDGEEVIITKLVGRLDRLIEDMVGRNGWGAFPGAILGGGSSTEEVTTETET
jgi:hypothetical protein